MAISLSEFFFPPRRPPAPPAPLPRQAPPGYSRSQVRPSLGQQVGEGFGRFVMRGGPVGAVLDWATKQTRKDIEQWVEEKVPIVAWRKPGRELKKIAKRQVKNVAWGVIKGVSSVRDKRAWKEIMGVERVWQPIPPEELARFEGSLERMRALGEISLDDATKREVLDFLRNPRENFYLYQAFERRMRLGTMDEHVYREVYNLFRAHEFRPIADDPLRRQLSGIFARGGDISEELWEQLQKVGDEGLIHADVLDFLREKFERDQFFAGARDSLAWAHELWSGKWKREVWKRARPWRRLQKPYRAPARRLFGRAGERLVPGAARALRRTVGRLARTVRQAVRPVLRATVSAAKKLITKIGGQTLWTSLSSAVGGAVGSLAGPVGTVAGFVAAPIATKLTKWTLQLACLGCGCATVGFVGLIIFIVVTVGGAFTGLGGPGAGGAARMVEVRKVASPRSVDVVAPGVPNPTVEFTFEITNNSSQEITGGTLVDRYDPENFTPLALAGGTEDPAAGTITWDIPSVPAGNKTTLSGFEGFVNAEADKIVSDRATFEGVVDGAPISAVGIEFVIVGEPSGQPPSGWPTVQGCVIQGPGSTHTHASAEAIDIAPLNPSAATPADLEILATHDGVAVRGQSSTYGQYVDVVSTAGFITRYAHLSIVRVEAGDIIQTGDTLGLMGMSGNAGNVLHLHYEFRSGELTMEPPYIPDVPESVYGCVGVDDCNYCFP